MKEITIFLCVVEENGMENERKEVPFLPFLFLFIILSLIVQILKLIYSD